MSRFKKKFPAKKGAAKIKDAKFSDLYKSTRSLNTSRRAQIQLNVCPYSSSSEWSYWISSCNNSSVQSSNFPSASGSLWLSVISCLSFSNWWLHSFQKFKIEKLKFKTEHQWLNSRNLIPWKTVIRQNREIYVPQNISIPNSRKLVIIRYLSLQFELLETS